MKPVNISVIGFTVADLRRFRDEAIEAEKDAQAIEVEAVVVEDLLGVEAGEIG